MCVNLQNKKKLRCFLEKFTQLTKILHDRRSRRSQQISSLWGGSDILSISTLNHYSRILKFVAVILLQKKTNLLKKNRQIAAARGRRCRRWLRVVGGARPKSRNFIGQKNPAQAKMLDCSSIAVGQLCCDDFLFKKKFPVQLLSIERGSLIHSPKSPPTQPNPTHCRAF